LLSARNMPGDLYHIEDQSGLGAESPCTTPFPPEAPQRALDRTIWQYKIPVD
jgi:hypothetical protein